jgi:hypothetical protein
MRALIINIIFSLIAILHSPLFLVFIPISGIMLTVGLLPWLKNEPNKISKAAIIGFAASSILLIAGYWFDAIKTYYLYR